jgi:hypothetical protein
MKKIGSFRSSRWGRVDAWRATYLGENGPTAVTLTLQDGEPLATLSVNMYQPECSHDSSDLPPDCFYAKRWGENEAISAEALAGGLFVERADLPQADSGYVTAPVWQIGSPS